jgi:hypothetical protein
MLISIVNFTHGNITDEYLQTVVRAINRQVSEDFEPYWGMGARLRVEGRLQEEPDETTFVDLRGDAIIYVWDKVNLDDALGFHFRNSSGIPFGFVFQDLAISMGESWTVTLSHEVLELIADPDANLLVAGPHPDPNQDRFVFFWYEMCDAVQAESYQIDQIDVSNFVLPLYFTGTRSVDEAGVRNDFLGRVRADGTTLPSFGVNPGGYTGFFDPEERAMRQFRLAGDKVAERRIALKSNLQQSRRSLRYENFSARATRRAPVHP